MNENSITEVRARGLVQYYVRKGDIVKKKCEICGGDGSRVEAHHDNYNNPSQVRRLCAKCHKEWHKHNEPIRADINRECGVCGKKFKSNGKKRKYCSTECAYKATLEVNRRSRAKHSEEYKAKHKASIKPKQCVECGKAFIPFNGQKYCSSECRREARLRQKREEYYRHKDKYAVNFKEYRKRMRKQY